MTPTDPQSTAILVYLVILIVVWDFFWNPPL